MKHGGTVLLLVASLMLAAPAAAETPMAPVHPITTPKPPPGGDTAAGSRAATAPQATSKPVASPPAAPEAAIEPPSANAAAETAADARENGPVKAGLWQFTTHLLGGDGAAATASPAASPPVQNKGDGIAATYTDCIRSEDAVPAAFGGGSCTLEHKERRGATITWSANCAATHARAEGVAQYHGDTMEATIHSQLPGADGKPMNVTQRVTGRYLGECLATASLSPATAKSDSTGNAATAEKPAAGGEAPQSAVQTAAAPSAAKPESAAAAAEPTAAEQKPEQIEHEHPHHIVRRRYRYARRRHYYGGYGGWASVDRGAAFAGPAPYSNQGP